MNKNHVKILGYLFGIIGTLTAYLAVEDIGNIVYVVSFMIISIVLMLIGAFLYWIGISE